jgi:MFS family permease
MIDEREKKIILLVASLSSFLVPFTGSSITVALPAMAGQFHADAVTLGWITSAYIIAAAVFIVPFVRYADIIGRKKIFILGLLVFTIASLFCAFSPTEEILIGARFLQGIGGAMLFSTSVAIVTQVYGPGERGWALGITIATVYAGLSIGPFLGGILTDHFGWPSIFLVNVPLSLLTIALTLWGVKHEWADAAGEGFDVGGAVIYGILLFSLIYGMLLFPDPAGLAWILAALVFGVLFYRWEKPQTSPLIDFSVFMNNRTFIFSNIAAMINYGATYGVSVLLSLYFQYIQGFSAETAGLILVAQPVSLPQGVIGVGDRQLSPRWSDTGQPGPVCDRQIAQQRRERPAVTGDVMHHQDQQVLLLGQPDQLGRNGQVPGQVEGVRAGLPDQLGRRLLVNGDQRAGQWITGW